MGERYFNPDFVKGGGGAETKSNAMKRAPVQHDEGDEKYRVEVTKYQQKDIDEHDESATKYQQNDIEKTDESATKYQQKDIDEHDESATKYQQNDIDEHDESATKYQQNDIDEHDESATKYQQNAIEKTDESATKYQQKGIEDHDESATKYQQKDIDEHDESDTKYQQNDIEKTDESATKYQQKDIAEHDESATKYQQKGIAGHDESATKCQQKHKENETKLQQKDFEKHEVRNAKSGKIGAKKVHLDTQDITEQKQILLPLISSASDFPLGRSEEQRDSTDRHPDGQDLTQENCSKVSCSVVLQEASLSKGDPSKKRYPAAPATECLEQAKLKFPSANDCLNETDPRERKEEKKIKNEDDRRNLGEDAEDIQCQAEKLPCPGPPQKSCPASDIDFPGGTGPTEHEEDAQRSETEIHTYSLDPRTDLADASDEYRATESTPARERAFGARSEVTRKRRPDLPGPTEHDEYAPPREPTENEDSEVLQDLQPAATRGKVLSSIDEGSLQNNQTSPAGDQGRDDVSAMTPTPCESTEASLTPCYHPLSSHCFSEEFPAVDSSSCVQAEQRNTVCERQASGKEASFVQAEQRNTVCERQASGKEARCVQEEQRNTVCESQASGKEASCVQEEQRNTVCESQASGKEASCVQAEQRNTVCERQASGKEATSRATRASTREGKDDQNRGKRRTSTKNVTRRASGRDGRSEKKPSAGRSQKHAHAWKTSREVRPDEDCSALTEASRAGKGRAVSVPGSLVRKRRRIDGPCPCLQRCRKQPAARKTLPGAGSSIKSQATASPKVAAESNPGQTSRCFRDQRQTSGCSRDQRQTSGCFRDQRQAPPFEQKNGLTADSRQVRGKPARNKRKTQVKEHSRSNFQKRRSKAAVSGGVKGRHLGAQAASTRPQLQRRNVNRQIHQRQCTASVNNDNKPDAETFVPRQPFLQGYFKSSVQSSSEDENCDINVRREQLPQADPCNCCDSNSQPSVTRLSRPADEDDDHSVHCPLTIAVHWRLEGQAAVTLQRTPEAPAQVGRLQPAVDLQGYLVDMHSHLDRADQGFTGELLSASNLQVRSEEGHSNVSSQWTVEENAWTTLTTHFRASGLYMEEASPCRLCRYRIANVILFNCHHVVVCNSCARNVEFCPLPECLAEVLCFMRVEQ